ncbi:MAG TPA: monomeric [FeFe] hydrogenase, partial [Candidatus Wallbacteria bacterium]|nr:monomeric [FeFe] hydrogenase [Candidatus Wallbacteria bacterium]
MFSENKAVQIRRELIKKTTLLFMKDELSAKSDRIPIEMFPKYSQSPRCCIYKARAIVKYRLMALFGFDDDDEKDELTPLSEYAKTAVERGAITHPLLTVIDEACSSCVKVNYFATNACRGCVARPCMSVCPKDAISVNAGQSIIDHNKCINCGKCMKACPYHAIIYIQVPCEEACPVNAISKNEHQKECIDFNKCIYCGKCINKCPFGAIMEKSQLIDVLKAIRSGKKVIAMLAPSIMGHFNASLGRLVTAIKKMGFFDVVEVALGADMTSEHEAREFIERMENKEKFMTSSCCYSYIELIEKHIPELKKYFSTTKTPMHFTAETVAKQFPDAVKVFISPCVSKKSEAIKLGVVDLVINIEELGAMMEALEIDPEKCEETEIKNMASSRGRGFPVTGGVAAAIKAVVGDSINPTLIGVLSRQNVKLLK